MLPDRTHPWQSYVLTLDPGWTATPLRLRCANAGSAATSAHMPRISKSFMARRACPVSADLFARQLAIPMHANLVEDDVAYVASALHEILNLRPSTGIEPACPSRME